MATGKSNINPAHYHATTPSGRKIEAVDVIEAYFAQDAFLAQAFKYMSRAGRKQSSSYLQDVGKALWWLAKCLIFHGAPIELPRRSRRKRKATKKVKAK